MVVCVVRCHLGGIISLVVRRVSNTIGRICGKSHVPTVVPYKHHIHPALHRILFALTLQSGMDSFDYIINVRRSLTGLPHCRMTLPMPMLSMSSRRQLGMKARSIAMVWLQASIGNLSALKLPSSTYHMNELKYTACILKVICISAKWISPKCKPTLLRSIELSKQPFSSSTSNASRNDQFAI